MKHWIAAAVFAAGLFLGSRSARAADDASDSSSIGRVLAQADTALQAGQADKTLGMIQSLPSAGIDNARAQNLACRTEFAMGQWDAAIRACQQAVALDPASSGNHLWLGRALGEKASQSSFMVAFSLGKRVLAEFHRAVDLDPQSADALSDLGEFYLEAPSLVGGGLDKAEGVAKELDRVDPVGAAELRAGIAGQHGNYKQAEAELKQALAVSPHPARQWSTLARFYGARSRWADMESAIYRCQQSAAADPRAAVALYDAAGVLIRYKRDPELAAKLLDAYLASSGKTEEAPAFVAEARLAGLRRNLGDAANAQLAMTAAYELAREYQPRRDLRR